MEVRFDKKEILRFMRGKNCIRDACNPKIDKSMLSSFSDMPEKQKAWVKGTMTSLRKTAPPAERLFAGFLTMHGVYFIPQAPFRILRRFGETKIYFADFYIPSKSTIIELDGGTHKDHNIYDMVRDEEFKRIGIRTIRISNKALKTRSYFDFDFIKPKENKPIGRTPISPALP